ncbi:hypothetical protein SLA2020_220250 [Shorea laevis]
MRCVKKKSYLLGDIFSFFQIGNAWIDDTTSRMGIYYYLWTHALNSDETHDGILQYCDFVDRTDSEKCSKYKKASTDEAGNIDLYNIYAPLCQDPAKNKGTSGSIYNFDPCTDFCWHQGLAWLYSGDTDSIVPVISSSYPINTHKLLIKTPWRTWYANNEVGRHVEEYEGLTFITVRGSGHLVPSYQPKRSLTMFSSFLQGTLPPWQ